MATRKNLSTARLAGIGSTLSSMSGPSTAPPPDPGDLPPTVAAELVKKVVSSAALAAEISWNATKPDEYGEYARTPTEGIAVKPADPLAGAKA